MKLGSLFDGSGGFPYAGSLCGIEPVWASEIEPYPVAVTKSRFPHMKHLGDVTKVNGADIEPVDIITFGSPCQDLSVAGKRAGLKHKENGDDETTRSGLFMEAIRIIKEMRGTTNGIYPRFVVWENVVGAFSSNGGWDFHTVLTELIRIKEPSAVMPTVPTGGWSYADIFSGSGWSLAYRTFDAQYWGVPQRRRRIYLVADFAGECAGEILFERESVQGYFETGRAPRERAATDAERGAGVCDCTGNQIAFHLLQDPISNEKCAHCITDGHSSGTGYIGVCYPKTAHTISARSDGSPQPDKGNGANIVAYCVVFKAGNGAKEYGIGYQEECSPTLSAGQSGLNQAPAICVKGFDARRNGDGGNSVPSVCIKEAYSIENHPADSRVDIDDSGKVQTITSRMGTGGGNVLMVLEKIPAIPIHDKATRYKGGGPTRNGDGAGNGLGIGKPGDPVPTLSTCDHHMVCYCMATGQANAEILDDKSPCLNCNHEQPIVAGVDCRNATEYPEMNGTLQAKSNGGFSYNCNQGVRIQYIIRRLTPTECARLQGFPDAWGRPDRKEDFTEEEYRFWLEVRNTHAAINGKAVKEYTKEQMLTWYNKLHTDSSEYKMWGNGIALPCALYVMQGITSTESGL